MTKATEELLSKLHGALADHMLKLLEEGDLRAADMSAISKFLNDNGISVGDSDPKAQELRDRVAARTRTTAADVLSYPFEPTDTRN